MARSVTVAETINETLGRLPVHQGKRCALCGRGPGQALLNIESSIHHGCTVRCVDQRACRRARRKG